MKTTTETPWGPSQSSREIAPGIIRHDTAAHGGYYLSPERVASMPKPLRDFKPWAGPNWYEEDCDWSIVALAFPQFFPDDSIPVARATLKHYKPELFEQMSAEMVTRGEGKFWFTIHYADRELARELNDPVLGVLQAASKEEAEALAGKDGDILSRAQPCASLWAVRMKDSLDTPSRSTNSNLR